MIKPFPLQHLWFIDAVFLPPGSGSIEKLRTNGNALHFINEAFKHCKAIGVMGEAKNLLLFNTLALDEDATHTDGSGVVFSQQLTDTFYSGFFNAIAQHRHWNRQSRDEVPA